MNPQAVVRTKMVAGAIVILLFALSWVIFAAAYAHGQIPERDPPEPWSGPEIQQCDKELWLRIKDGC